VKKPEYVLDSYALVAYLQDEAIAGRVEASLDQAAQSGAVVHMSLINLGEIATLIERRHGAARCNKALNELAAFPIEFEEVTLSRVMARHAVSFADAFAVALAQELDASVVTGDPEFRRVESLVRVSWL